MDAWQRNDWHRQYRRRHPLTQRFARSLAEIDDDAYRSTLEGPEPGEGPSAPWLLEACCWILAVTLLTCIVTAPRWWPIVARLAA